MEKKELFSAIQPLIRDGINIRYDPSEDIMDCRSFRISCGLVSLRRVYEESGGYKLLHITTSTLGEAESRTDFVTLRVGESPADALTLYASPIDKSHRDSDWSLLIKVLAMAKFKSLMMETLL